MTLKSFDMTNPRFFNITQYYRSFNTLKYGKIVKIIELIGRYFCPL